ncbi:hypothetical protein [uncultured Kordia sp.]|uniref:hypothetical protein n=1 Tax=uncultured Kordia sp. TaxID=507699 RepID=UPI00262E610F|nr:hypothetical protein [uncultured Kordia sp.]
MKSKLFLLVICIGFFFSCNNDDNGTIILNPISGTWKLIDVSCECAPANFQANHLWNFNLSQNAVTVTNAADENLQILDSGTYPFVITTNTITIESVTYDYYFEGEILFLADEPESDGPLMKFERQ